MTNSSSSHSRAFSPRVLSALAGLGLALALGSAADAGDKPLILQWFETSWKNIETRLPDAFMTGYNGMWIPPVAKASFASPGYDPFDRFDLGSPGAETAYGTAATFDSMVTELHRAGVEVYPDLIMNHNGARTTNASFYAQGGYPGFWTPRTGATPWGDFHDGTKQSVDPNGANYDLWLGDLVGLIDIAQETNFQYIRQPVSDTPPAGMTNIPPGTVRNRPDPNNAQFYPDRALTPVSFTNPANGELFTIYPFNTADPLAGDAVMDNGTGMLMRNIQWMMDVHHVDGFRLDASKHIPQWFWNNYFDTILYQRRTLPSGAKGTGFSFGENVSGNDFVQTYIRNKDGFGNRDALDLNQAGQLRDIRAARGSNSWANVLGASIDNQDDNLNNGSQGVHHVFSHDNGSAGDGGSAPGLPGIEYGALPEHCFQLFASGRPIVYFNGREMHDKFSGSSRFWPREGNPTALGDTNPYLQRLVQTAAQYVRADNANDPAAVKCYFYPLNSTDPVNSSQTDVLVFERSNYNAGLAASNQIGVNAAASVLVGVNDSYAPGVMFRSVQTSFPVGTRLHELTGAWTDPVVNASNQISELLVVDSNRRVLIPVPNNAATVSGSTIEHHRGYVAYGPAAPTGVLTIQGATAVIPADPAGTPAYRRRVTPLDVVTTPTFEIRLTTSKTDAGDPAWDDRAVFRIDGGFADYNGSGAYDQALGLVDAGFEQFITQRNPIAGAGGTGTTGLYRQTILTSQLSEGIHYLTVYCFRQRTDGGLPIFKEFRRVFYVDRSPPVVTLSPTVVPIGAGQFQFRVTTGDRTVNAVYVIQNVPGGVDARTLIAPSNLATQYDRSEWRLNVSSIPSGVNQITVVAYELSGNSSVTTVPVTVAIGSGDVNGDGAVTIDDLYASYLLSAYQQEADMNRNGTLEAADRQLLEAALRVQEVQKMKGSQR
ncbi:hypothetical protein BH11PLA1_BH11PLA1_02130 [soil metagenome]